MAEKRTAIEKVLQDPKAEIGFDDVLRLRYWQTHRSKAAAPWRELGDLYFDQAFQRFKTQESGVDVALFSRCGIGVYKTPTELRYLVLNNALRFDWSDAHMLATRIDEIAERAKEWWGPLASKGKGRRQQTAAAELRRFIERAVGLMSGVFSAVDNENPRDGQPSPEKRSAHYHAKLDMLRARTDDEDVALKEAFQRSAQACYGRGMSRGAVILAGGCLALGLAFYLGGVPAWYGVAFPAGAAGALVSVLQRMSSSSPKSRLTLDFNAGQQMLTYYGALRPFIGGLLGYMIFVFFKGSLLPALSISTTAPLATYAGLGFLGGFNERWAQDMLVGSGIRLEREAG